MTARDLSARIGTEVYMEPVRGLRFLCRITNAKQAYGHPRFELTPVSGEGRAWVDAARLAPTAAQPEGQ